MGPEKSTDLSNFGPALVGVAVDPVAGGQLRDLVEPADSDVDPRLSPVAGSWNTGVENSACTSGSHKSKIGSKRGDKSSSPISKMELMSKPGVTKGLSPAATPAASAPQIDGSVSWQ